MTLETGIYIYLGGFAFWSFLMGCQGSLVDSDFVWSAALWPLCALSLVGQLVRRVFKCHSQKFQTVKIAARLGQ